MRKYENKYRTKICDFTVYIKGQSPESYLYQPKHLPQPRRFSNWSNAIEICVHHPGYLPSWCQKNHQVFTKQSFFWFRWDFVSPSFKEAGPGVVGPLTTLFNLSLHSNRVPDEWKEAIVCPILKGGRKARQDPTNYRPISLTSCVARTMEKLVNNQMLACLSENSLLYKHLPNHSTVTQLCYLAHQWQMALEKGEQVHTVFLDLSKAYDRVSIPGLLFKLSNRIWVFQTHLYNGCHRFWWIDSSVFG